MVHRIHNAGVFPQLEGGIDFSEVTYPQHIYTCAKCHGGAPEENLSFEIMTAANCGSCHDDVDFATGTNHAAGAQPDSACTTCHVQGIAGSLDDIATAHDPTPPPENVSEYAVTITMTPPANGTYYVAGEAPVVTVTLAGALQVDYDANPEEGTTDSALAVANLYVYGPRAEAVPVLTTNSTTDPAWDPTTNPTQGHSLLLTGLVSTDPLVQTDNNAYRYQLLPIPADMQPGTYMVRFEGEDYGTPGAPAVPEYWTASSGLITFQVGQAEEEPKVSGDACTNCHGDTIMHLTGAHPHHVPFDTDGCLGCHDKSENYGNYIGNRVHAVHSASATGDLHLSGGLPRDWSEVTFPQEVNNCTICHTDTTTDTPVWRTPDEVACGGCHGTQPNPDPADYPDVDPAQLTKEAAAAQHMEAMGGDWLADTPPTLQCLVCHGEGKIADLYNTHELYLFPSPTPPAEP
jgi:hypothetical protein